MNYRRMIVETNHLYGEGGKKDEKEYDAAESLG